MLAQKAKNTVKKQDVISGPKKKRNNKKKITKKPATPIPEIPQEIEDAIDQAIKKANEELNTVIKLTDKERKFCDEYVKDLNATQAAIRAGYSKNSARQLGTETLSKPAIRNLIRDKQFAMKVKSTITAEMVIEGLAKIAFADIRGIATWSGTRFTLKSSDEITDEQALAISEISPTQFGLKVKLNDRVAALEKLGKHLGILSDNVNLIHKNAITMDVTNFTPEQAAQAYKNALKPSN